VQRLHIVYTFTLAVGYVNGLCRLCVAASFFLTSCPACVMLLGQPRPKCTAPLLYHTCTMCTRATHNTHKPERLHCTYIDTYSCTYILHTCSAYPTLCLPIHIPTYLHRYIHTYMCTYMHTYMCVHTCVCVCVCVWCTRACVLAHTVWASERRSPGG
jgi:hypothetical protein